MKIIPLSLLIGSSFTVGFLANQEWSNTSISIESQLPSHSLSAVTKTKEVDPKVISKTPDADLVKGLLKEDLGTRKFSFSDVIKSSTGKTIIPYNSNSLDHVNIKQVIDRFITQTMKEMNQDDSPVRGLRRINEASRFFEDALRKKLTAHPHFSCAVPKNRQGKEQRSGYPDLLITHLPSGTKCYLDPKLYEAKSEASSFRTFYYEPKSRTIKVQHDALHLLLGIKHDGNDGKWQFLGAQLIDLSKLNVRLKAEFQASNRDMYRSTLRLPEFKRK